MIVVAASWTILRSKVDAQSYARIFVLHQEEDLGRYIRTTKAVFVVDLWAKIRYCCLILCHEEEDEIESRVCYFRTISLYRYANHFVCASYDGLARRSPGNLG